jgi:hypothetical protein
MGAMKDLRAQLVADLAVTGVPVMDDWIIRAEPPCIYITPPNAELYVTGGQQFGMFRLAVDVTVLVALKESDGADRDELEDLTEAVLANSADWALTGVDSPGTASLPDSTIVFLGIVVHLAKQFTL